MHFPNVVLDEYVVMPNHVHGILIIQSDNAPITTITGKLDVETQNLASLQRRVQSGNYFGPQSKNLGSIVRGFKIGVTKYARANNIRFDWQPRFHDRIIRDERELNNIQEYIRNNPLQWQLDQEEILPYPF